MSLQLPTCPLTQPSTNWKAKNQIEPAVRQNASEKPYRVQFYNTIFWSREAARSHLITKLKLESRAIKGQWPLRAIQFVL